MVYQDGCRHPTRSGTSGILIKPTPGGDLAFAEATMESPYGKISTRWEKKKDVLRSLITVPANSKAILYLPTSQAAGITEGGKPLKSVDGVTPLRVVDQRAVIALESGTYEFLSRMN
jgi:alpha-L-rhamnosidase